MKRIFCLMVFISGCTLFLHAQRIKIYSVFQLIETGKYEEAKTVIDEVIGDKKTLNWPRTWYAKGLLCQTAYQDGIKKNDKKKYEMYPDQLYLAYESYQKALSLDKGGRYESLLAPAYVLLANDFQGLGERHFAGKKYDDALRAFENALEVMQSPFLSVKIDSNLIYNTAVAAYESQKWEKAIEHLGRLHEEAYSANSSHLLYSAYMETGDTASAEKVLVEAVEHYKDNEEMVLLLADLVFRLGETERVITILDDASSKDTSVYIYPYTKGLIYQKTGQYKEAIEAYETAHALAPGESKIYTNIGICYNNIGVEIDANARTITNNRAFLEEKAKSTAAFESAILWLEQALKMDEDNQTVIKKLYQLYKILNITDKLEIIEGKVR